MNKQNLIKYGSAAIGGVVGNVVNQKVAKFGTIGRVALIAAGVVGGYYLSSHLMGDDRFRNASGKEGGCGCGCS